MRMRWLWVMFVGVYGCDVQAMNARIASSVGLPPPPPQQASAGIHDDENADGHLANLLDRAKAAQKKADEAVRLDGTPEAAQVQRTFADCGLNFGREKCAEFAASGRRSKVGELAGLASFLAHNIGTYPYAMVNGGRAPTDPQPLFHAGEDVAQAEGAANEAMAEAQQVLAARDDKQAKQRADDALIRSAMLACDANPAECKTMCDGGDLASCVGWGLRLWKKEKPPKLVEAQAAIGKACQAGMQGACLVAAPLVAEIQAAGARIDQVWQPVEEAGDAIAQKMWIVEYEVSKLGQMSPPQRRVTEQQIHGSNLRIAAMVQQAFCPAKKALLTTLGPREFTPLAAAHCRDRPPSGSAQGRFFAGAETGEVVLRKQCQAAFASACP